MEINPIRGEFLVRLTGLVSGIGTSPATSDTSLYQNKEIIDIQKFIMLF